MVPSAPLGFVILSHAAGPQLARLIGTLNRLYADPPIVIHHDFSQSLLPLAESELGANISIVRPHFETRWAHISLTDATLVALAQLHRQAPAWTTLLSTLCYPAMAPSAVLAELSAASCDAFIGAIKLPLDPKTQITTSIQASGERVFDPTLPHAKKNLPGWLGSAYRRYNTGDGFFHEDRRCFVGDWWFTVNAKAVAKLIASRHEHEVLRTRYANVFAPEESYFHTVLGNDAGLKLCTDNKRYADWSLQQPHPRALELRDLPAIQASGCHFARKLVSGKSDALRDALDQLTT